MASLFRNFLLAERILRAANCGPVSYPRLPPTHQHAMWQSWDMAAEMCLLQLDMCVFGHPIFHILFFCPLGLAGDGATVVCALVVWYRAVM